MQRDGGLAPGNDQGGDQQNAEAIGNPPGSPEFPEERPLRQGCGAGPEKGGDGVHQGGGKEQGQYPSHPRKVDLVAADAHEEPSASQRFQDIGGHEAETREKRPRDDEIGRNAGNEKCPDDYRPKSAGIEQKGCESDTPGGADRHEDVFGVGEEKGDKEGKEINKDEREDF